MNFTKEQIFIVIFNIVLIIFASILISSHLNKNIKINIKKLEKKYKLNSPTDANQDNQDNKDNKDNQDNQYNENVIIENNANEDSHFMKDIINDMDSYVDPLENENES